MKTLISLILVGLLAGCLKTRSELKGDNSGNMRTDASGSYVAGNMGQQQRAQIDSRFFEIDRDFRQLYGKIETLEKKVDDTGTAPQTATLATSTADSAKVVALEKRISTLEEALLAIDKKVNSLASNKTSAQVIKTTKKPKGPFGLGEQLYAKKKYVEAITSYDNYRKRYPRGKRYAQATLKMGLCFQKLKMTNDAKAFYKEVIQRYPNTKVSIRAEANLKSI